jgi:hypothetical protein
MSDEASKIILSETVVSAIEEPTRRRFLYRRKPPTTPQPLTHCENCGAELHGHWCARCGQPAVEYRRSFRHVIVDVLDSFLNWDSKFFASLFWLIARPWVLTNEFVRGRRVRYLHPVRLYLLASIIFFFVVNYWAKSIHVGPGNLTTDEQQAGEQVTSDQDIPAEVRSKIDAAFKQAETSPSPAAAAESPSASPSTEPSGARPIRGSSKLFDFDSDGGSTPFERWLEARAKEKLGEKGTKAELFLKTLVSNLPYMMLCCIPLFALLLKLLYIRRHIFYIDHLVYALHIHSFAYAGVMVAGLATFGINHVLHGTLAVWLIALLWTAFGVQILLSIRRVYRQGWIKTVLKFFIGGALYYLILLLGLAGTFFATLAIP